MDWVRMGSPEDERVRDAAFGLSLGWWPMRAVSSDGAVGAQLGAQAPLGNDKRHLLLQGQGPGESDQTRLGLEARG